jgi:hypothetical protein
MASTQFETEITFYLMDESLAACGKRAKSPEMNKWAKLLV